MKKSWLIVIIVVLVVVLAVLIVKSKFLSRPGLAALTISTTPGSQVYLDGNNIGKTPFYNSQLEAKEYLVKLVPDQQDNLAWEKKVSLTPNVMTVINRNFAASDSASAGDTVWLEKIDSKQEAHIFVMSNVIESTVRVDGDPKGYTPRLIEDLPPGSYQITVYSPGYEERTIQAKSIAGYKLNIDIQLAQKINGISHLTPTLEMTPTGSQLTPTQAVVLGQKISPKPTLANIKKPYVTVKETPTGWLRVREEPSTSANELAKLDPGTTYPYLDKEENGWYKIEYETGKEGWISKVYADLTEE